MRERPAGGETTAEEATLDLSRRMRAPAPADSESPAVAEARIRARGKHLIIGGIVLTVVNFAAAIVWHVGFGAFVPAAYMTPLYAASCGAILLGCMEYITRHSRAQQALAVQVALRVQADQIRLVDLLGEELKQRYYAGAGDMLRDSPGLLRTGTDPAVGRAAPTNRSGGDVVEIRSQARRRNDPYSS